MALLTWKTVMIAAAKVSKLVGGVPLSKLNLRSRKEKQKWNILKITYTKKDRRHAVNAEMSACFQVCWYWLSSKQLHPQQGKDHNEEKEEEEQTDDGLHGVQQRNHQVSKRSPVPEEEEGQRKEEFYLIIITRYYFDCCICNLQKFTKQFSSAPKRLAHPPLNQH